MSAITATLGRRLTPASGWSWAVEGAGTPVALAEAPPQCLSRLMSVHRSTASSVTNFRVRDRYVAAENLLDELWHTVVVPLVDEFGLTDTLRLRVPGRFVRLPLTTARDRRTGEALIHLTEPLLGIGDHVPETQTDGPVVRFDGHFRDVAREIRRRVIPQGATLLLMGCRTAELVPLLSGTGADYAVVTAWDVEDRHCQPMGDALEVLLGQGLSVTQALRSIQAGRSWCHPYEWAGYSVVDLRGHRE